MVNTAVKVSASPNHITYVLTGDGTVVGPSIANATLLADMVMGPLRDAYNGVLTTQAAMRNALLGGLIVGPILGGGGCYAIIQMITTVADTTAQVNQPSVDVDTDAVSTTKAKVNITMSDTTGTVGFLHLMHMHSLIQ